MFCREKQQVGIGYLPLLAKGVKITATQATPIFNGPSG
jgi:hypothetical protein